VREEQQMSTNSSEYFCDSEKISTGCDNDFDIEVKEEQISQPIM
jgi:hypothetical protein